MTIFPAGFNENKGNPYASMLQTLTGYKHLKEMPIFRDLAVAIKGL